MALYNYSYYSLSTLITGYSRKALKTLAKLDYEKINNDLIELLIEWIMEGKHDVGETWISECMCGVEHSLWRAGAM